MRRPTLRATITLALMGLTACGGAGGDAAPAASPMEPPMVGAVMDARAEAADDSGGSTMGKRSLEERPAPAPPPPPPGLLAQPAKPAIATPPATPPGSSEVAAIRAPMLIYTAELVMAVFEVEAAIGRIEALGRDLGGFLAKRGDLAITIRVPAQRFDEAVKKIEALGDMVHRNVTAQDVTEEFRDLEVRLKSSRAVQQRLIDLLAKATKVEESVMIERELERVSGEIERVEGRMKFLRDRAAFSTITVTFQAKPKETIGKGAVRLPSPWLYNLGLRRLLSL